MPQIAIPLAVAGGTAAINKIAGGGKPNSQPSTPKDLLPMRQSNIGLLNYLLGFNQPGAPWNPQQQQPQQSPMPQGTGGFTRGAPTPYPGGNGWGATPGQQNMSPMPQAGIGGGMPGSMHPSFSMDGMAPQAMGSAGPALGSMVGGGGPALGLGGGMAGGLGGAAGGALGGMFGGLFGGGGGGGGGGLVAQTVNGMQGGGGLNNRASVDMMYPGQANMQQSLFGGGGAPQGSPIQRGGAAQFGQMPNTGAGMPQGGGGYGMQPSGGFSTQLPQTQSDPNSPLGRIESYFGPLGTPTTALQQQSMGGMSQFLNSNPYGQSNNALSQIMGTGPKDYFGGAQNAANQLQNANLFGAAKGAANKLQNGSYFGNTSKVFNNLANYNPFQPAQGALEGMFKQNPGQGMMQALEPMYQRELAAANQDGGRFGSANAIMRSHALDDYNLAAQKALQYGTDQQINAAGQYGQMGNSLINARNMAGQGLLGLGNGLVNQQSNALQGLIGIGNGQVNQLSNAMQGMVGIGNGRSSYANQFMGNQINAAGQLANNQNSMFNNYNSAYNVGSQQAGQEAQRQQQALQILSGLLGTSQSASMGGPSVVQPNAGQQAIQAGLGTLPYVLGGGMGGGGGSPMPFNNPGAAAPSFGIPYGF